VNGGCRAAAAKAPLRLQHGVGLGRRVALRGWGWRSSSGGVLSFIFVSRCLCERRTAPFSQRATSFPCLSPPPIPMHTAAAIPVPGAARKPQAGPASHRRCNICGTSRCFPSPPKRHKPCRSITARPCSRSPGSEDRDKLPALFVHHTRDKHIPTRSYPAWPASPKTNQKKGTTHPAPPAELLRRLLPPRRALDGAADDVVVVGERVVDVAPLPPSPARAAAATAAGSR
jgi:hypothetical protein